MNLHKEEHEIIKQSISKALFNLMEQQAFSDITITQLVKKAGIARSTYYRNYCTKEDVLEEYIDDILQEFRSEYPVDTITYRFTTQHILRVLEYVSRYHKDLQTLHKCGLSSIFLDRVNHYLLRITSRETISMEEKFDLYAYAGAEFNIIFHWLINDMKESPYEVADYLEKHR